MEDAEPAYDPDKLPEEIPIFPLGGVLLLPHGQLPLNIFEDRYIAMVDDALKSDRMIGMIQTSDPAMAVCDGQAELFDTGCAGRIKSFSETEDGRYLITLAGICRFKIREELEPKNGYRRVKPCWQSYREDLKPQPCLDLDRDKLKDLLGNYFDMHELSCDWDAIDGATDQKLITCLAMVCPFDPNEKQALLEEACCRKRADMFMTMLEMAVHDDSCCGGGCH